VLFYDNKAKHPPEAFALNESISVYTPSEYTFTSAKADPHSSRIREKILLKIGHPSKVLYTLWDHYPIFKGFLQKKCKVLWGSYNRHGRSMIWLLATTKNETPLIAMPWWEFHIKGCQKLNIFSDHRPLLFIILLSNIHACFFIKIIKADKVNCLYNGSLEGCLMEIGRNSSIPLGNYFSTF